MGIPTQHLSHSPAIGTGGDARYFPYNTPHGPITIRSNNGAITDVALGEVRFDGVRKPSAETNAAATQILEYLAGKRRAFDVALDPQGSAFQIEVWRAIEKIPYGSTITCAQLAERIDRPGAHRSVGAAVRSNPLAMLIPTHRVIGANGKQLGTGRASDVKGALLRMETSTCENAKRISRIQA